MSTNQERYAPPTARLEDVRRTPEVRPPSVKWAVIALWASYALMFTHAAIVIGDLWLSWPPEFIVRSQILMAAIYAVVIYCTSRGHYWARLMYAVFLGVRTVQAIRNAPADWQDSHGLVLMTVVFFLLQYLAMYWLFAEPGRRWFARSRID